MGYTNQKQKFDIPFTIKFSLQPRIMSMEIKMNHIFEQVLHNMTSRECFTSSDMKTIFEKAKHDILDLLAEEHARRIQLMMQSFHTIPMDGDMCIEPDKNIRIHV